MKSRILSLLASATIALFAIGSAAVAQDCASQGGIVVSPSQGVVFSQVSYSFTDANVPNSPTGQLDINVPQLTTLMSSGFINVVTGAGWVAQNVPVLPGYYDQYGYSDVSTTFNLNIAAGTPVASLQATVCYSSQPLVQITSSSFTTFAVAANSYNAEGLSDKNLNEVPPPPPIAAMAFDPQGQNLFALQIGHTNVQTASMQCGPAAFANNFAWLKTFWGVPIPDNNVKGLRNWVPGSLVGQMDMNIQSFRGLYGRCIADVVGRLAWSRERGIGVPVISQVLGSMQYLNKNGINNLTLKHQGLSPFQCDGFTGARNYNWVGLTSTGQGVKVDPNFIINEVQANSAVEYDAVLFNGFGQAAGGHVMDIIGAGTTNGKPWIMYVSDHLQTNVDHYDQFGTTSVDFSYLKTTAAQPLIVGGPQNGTYIVAVITQHP